MIRDRGASRAADCVCPGHEVSGAIDDWIRAAELVLQKAKDWKAWRKTNTGALASERSQIFRVVESTKTHGARIRVQIPKLYDPASHLLG